MAGEARTVERMDSAVNELCGSVTRIIADLELIRAAMGTHTHDGVTVGAGVTGAATAATFPAAAALLGSTITQRYQF